MRIWKGLLFISCSHLVIVNASTSKLIYKQPYPFHVNSIIINGTFLTAYGQMYYAVFRITGSKDDTAKIRLLYKAELPVLGRYESFLYLSNIKMMVIITKDSLSYGKITGED
jgi:hypothetical protein